MWREILLANVLQSILHIVLLIAKGKIFVKAECGHLSAQVSPILADAITGTFLKNSLPASTILSDNIAATLSADSLGASKIISSWIVASIVALVP